MVNLRWLLAVAGLATGACGGGESSGQTGSASCVEPASCGCDALADHLLVRATVVSVDVTAKTSTLAVDEVYNPALVFKDAAPGWHIVGPYSAFDSSRAREDQFPSCEASGAGAPAVGDVVLATFRLDSYRGRDCPGCNESCPEGCVPLRDTDTVTTGVWMMPWQDSYDFGGMQLAADDLAALSDPAACAELFPPPETPPCNDTPSLNAPDSGGCAASPSPAREGSSRAWLLGLLAAAACHRVRARRRSAYLSVATRTRDAAAGASRRGRARWSLHAG
jgi:hypothetical protein